MAEPTGRLGRRRLLVAGGALLLGSWWRAWPAWAQPATVVPRSAWGGDLPPDRATRARGGRRRALPARPPHRILQQLRPGRDRDQLRGFYAFHTGDRGWPDVAYNFFVDRYGVVYEGRTGSLDAPIKGDATGGSQGFALLCCFVGDHTTEPPTAEAQTSMVALLAALADRYAIPTAPGTTTTFISRGSNRWPAGTEVTAATISGHRDMSQTELPRRRRPTPS